MLKTLEMMKANSVQLKNLCSEARKNLLDQNQSNAYCAYYYQTMREVLALLVNPNMIIVDSDNIPVAFPNADRWKLYTRLAARQFNMGNSIITHMNLETQTQEDHLYDERNIMIALAAYEKVYDTLAGMVAVIGTELERSLTMESFSERFDLFEDINGKIDEAIKLFEENCTTKIEH